MVDKAVRWENAIIIIDEAHNLETVARDATSVDLDGITIGKADDEATRAIRLIKGHQRSFEEFWCDSQCADVFLR